ncbi:sugar ABC transporter substrate-binding protein [Fodinicola feengrottensis]|uniref:Sugar ABC transporter substrate-binding protein n=2 Tax=Fodinicola feengrottensis TaxID=435914 RepID=A0ABN2JC22_9ACTN
MAAAALAVAALAAATGCGGAGGGSAAGTINWWTWDEKQAQAYQVCANAFEKANPGATVKISQYDVVDYFTKLTAGFVAGNAPDAFQDSVQYFQAYANQHQLLPLDDFISKNHFDMTKYSVGVSSWKFTDGKQYALPLDWAAAGIYYNKALLTKAGYTDKDIQSLNWNPDNGGTFDKMVAHLTVDNKGVRGDQPGFDKNHVATFGAGAMGTNDFSGQTTWNALVSTLGWTQGDKSTWPSTFHYSDPRFVKTMDYIRSLADRGYAPKFGEFSGSNGQNTISDIDLLGSAKVALEESGSWSAGEFAKLPTVKVGIAPVPYGPDGKTRKMTSNSNGNNIWAGTKNPDLTWKWVSYMGSAECQTAAGKSGTFFPSIPSAMDATAKTLAAQGIDLSVYTAYEKDGNLFPAVVYGNGAAMQQALQPLFEAYFSHQRNDDVFQEMTTKSQQVLAKKQ